MVVCVSLHSQPFHHFLSFLLFLLQLNHSENQIFPNIYTSCLNYCKGLTASVLFLFNLTQIMSLLCLELFKGSPFPQSKSQSPLQQPIKPCIIWPLLFTSFILLHPHRPLCCSSNMSNILLPQGLRNPCFLYLKCFSLRHAYASFPHLFQVFPQIMFLFMKYSLANLFKILPYCIPYPFFLSFPP